MFKVSGLTKTYTGLHNVVKALDNLSFDIPPQSFMVITGPSGSGKTTLLLTLGGMVHPSDGQIFYKGSNIYNFTHSQLSTYRNREIGFVLQTFNLVPYLTTIENVLIPILFSEGDKKLALERATSLLEKVGLSDRRDHLPRELSVGQQQRVAIARALANDPQVILADEPTGNLDPDLSIEILSLLKELNEKDRKTIIMVTHSPKASEYGNLWLYLKKGQIHSSNRTI